MSDRQELRSGAGSVNIQSSGDVNFGVSYTEARMIALDVFRANFLQMRDMAREIAESRAQQILDSFLEKLRTEKIDPSITVSDPDMQYAIFDAQKGFARSGEPELGLLLSDLLLRRSKEPQRTTLQLVLNESLQVAPKLNVHQLDLLSLSWVMRCTKFKFSSKEAIFDSYAQWMEPFSHDLRAEDSSYSHMQYAGCGAIEMGEITILRILVGEYPELFQTHQMDPKIIETFMQHSPTLRRVAEYWASSQAKSFTLTSVGMALANAHFCAKFPDLTVPLTIWVK
ncbi:MAG TPA: LPO_1073/Vpar_1526 family protein [Candidatus Dormibacteraeota bacterium]|nr:LPO_1073/Vpar_1526 family protein [Candidatus Dormibacteraeota bacterium]